MEEKRAYSYNEIVLEPGYSETIHRGDLNCNSQFLGREFNSVAIPANMKCVIDFKLAEKLSELNYFYVLHRFYDYISIINWIEKNQHLKTISISIGVNEIDRNLLDNISSKNLRVDFITIDVAHGHHKLVKDMIYYIYKQSNFKYTKIIAGNIGTVKAVKDLTNWGADAVKIGLSMGKSCTTYNCTGVGTPMFSTVFEIFDQSKIPIVADGQIREVGDICKSLVAGATMVMIGSEFAKCIDSPADTQGVSQNKYHKVFFGSASSMNKGNNQFIEGTKVLLEGNWLTYEEYFRKINDGVRSCMSYAGVRDIKNLTKMAYQIVSPRN